MVVGSTEAVLLLSARLVGAAGPHQADLTFPWATSEFRVGTVAILALEST